MNIQNRILLYLYPLTFFASNIFIPNWLVGPNNYLSGLRLAILGLFWYFLLMASYHFDQSIETNNANTQYPLKTVDIKKINIWHNNSILLVLSIILVFIMYWRFLFYPITSGYDEPQHVYQILTIYDFFTLGNVNNIVGKVLFLIVLGLISLILIFIFKNFSSIYNYSRNSYLKFTLVSLVIFSSFYLVGFTVFDILTSLGLFLHPTLPEIVYRFGPFQAITFPIFYLVLGINSYVFRLYSIVFIILILYNSVMLIFDLVENEIDYKITDNKFSIILRVLLIILFSIYFAKIPVNTVYLVLFYDMSGEVLFAILSVRYLLKYLLTKKLFYLQLNTISLIFGLLFRRSILYLIITTGIFLTFYHRNELKETFRGIIKRRSVATNNLFIIYNMILPAIFAFNFIILLFTVPASHARNSFDFSKVSIFGELGKSNFVDYYVIIYNQIGLFFFYIFHIIYFIQFNV